MLRESNVRLPAGASLDAQNHRQLKTTGVGQGAWQLWSALRAVHGGAAAAQPPQPAAAARIAVPLSAAASAVPCTGNDMGCTGRLCLLWLLKQPRVWCGLCRMGGKAAWWRRADAVVLRLRELPRGQGRRRRRQAQEGLLWAHVC